MRFRLINEGINFVDIKKNKDGDYIDKKNGKLFDPAYGEIFWDHDEKDETKPLIQPENDDPKELDPDKEPDDIDPKDIDPDKIKIGNGGYGNPVPIEPLLRKLIALIKERWDIIESADTIGRWADYNIGKGRISELEEEVDLLQIKQMIQSAESLLKVADSLGNYLNSVNNFGDSSIGTIYKKMYNNIVVLIKLLYLIKDEPGQQIPEDVYIDGNKIYVDKNGDTNQKVKVRRYGVHEI